MEFEKLLAINGHSSLFTMVSRTNFGLIAESLADKKRIPVYQSMNVSTLTDISMFTNDGEISLKEVFVKMHEKFEGKETEVVKGSDADMKKMFGEIITDYDQERVYGTHIKKAFVWYNQLVKNNAIDIEAWKKADEEIEAKMKELQGDKEQGEEKKVAKEKDTTKKSTEKKVVNKTQTKQAAPKNAPTKKVQGVRKSGGS